MAEQTGENFLLLGFGHLETYWELRSHFNLKWVNVTNTLPFEGTALQLGIPAGAALKSETDSFFSIANKKAENCDPQKKLIEENNIWLTVSVCLKTFASQENCAGKCESFHPNFQSALTMHQRIKAKAF